MRHVVRLVLNRGGILCASLSRIMIDVAEEFNLNYQRLVIEEVDLDDPQFFAPAAA